MTRFQRDVLIGASVLASLVSIVLYAATGARWYSRHPDPQLDAMNQESELSSLFEEETGAPGASAQVASEYTFGLFPGGPNPIDMWSVATIAGPALMVGVGAVLLHRRSSKSSRTPQGAETQE